eukprot:5802574-Pyramimonas_sp.AAC.1
MCRSSTVSFSPSTSLSSVRASPPLARTCAAANQWSASFQRAHTESRSPPRHALVVRARAPRETSWRARLQRDRLGLTHGNPAYSRA